jgi:hypothetical protein
MQVNPHNGETDSSENLHPQSIDQIFRKIQAKRDLGLNGNATIWVVKVSQYVPSRGGMYCYGIRIGLSVWNSTVA